ncbi:hypothetical protein GFK26_26265 [Variovorax paradoxus]|uniref:Sel1 repeat family protein n=1 Tax=Variovorax paradoxus TaxID=34073 RepID=A0A5Q0MA89_VARPD|nr:tetratricopeptide repeat protein [Variovorax paradoxus]QFZ86018.1 hypothetical protein GFK26_26265 [Variovorax paradoxus]
MKRTTTAWLAAVLFACGNFAHAADELRTLFDQGAWPEFLERAEPAAKAGDAEAQFLLGKAYQGGNGVAVDLDRAAELYEQAAGQNNARALNNLAVLMLRHDSRNGPSLDPYKARKNLERALTLGLKLPTLFNLGTAENELEHFTAAGDWYILAYEAGFGDQALERAVRAYVTSLHDPFRSDTVETRAQVREKALKWGLLAAGKGMRSAMQNLGALHHQGAEYDQALVWFHRAAEKDEPTAFYALGQMHEEGQGVPKDATQAERWYARAAAANHPLAVGRIKERLYAQLDEATDAEEIRRIAEELRKLLPAATSSIDASIAPKLAFIAKLDANAKSFPSLAKGPVNLSIRYSGGRRLDPGAAWHLFSVRTLAEYRGLYMAPELSQTQRIASGKADAKGNLQLDPQFTARVHADLKAGRSLAFRSISIHELLLPFPGPHGGMTWALPPLGPP